MQLNKKKGLAARTLKVGKNKIIFNKQRLDEIKEAITKQDIKDLVNDGAIYINKAKGKKKKIRRGTRRREGSIKVKINKRKEEYINLTRKLRALLFKLRKKGILTAEEYLKLRKEIRARAFRSKEHMKERINQLIKNRKIK